MLVFRRSALACAALLIFSLECSAAPGLTTIQDILYRADGSRFTGQMTISWSSFQASNGTTVSANKIRLQVTNGYLHVQLAPTTNAQSAASYAVSYSDGLTQFNDTWLVPPSNAPVRLSTVRVPSQGSVLLPPADTIFQISNVVGLSAALSIRPVSGAGYTGGRAAVIDSSGALEAASGNPSDCIRVDGTSGACGSGSGSSVTGFIDGEIPAGAMDGSNTVFTLASTPNPASSVMLYRNGMLLRPAVDFTISGNAITFSGLVPQNGDVLLASYRSNVSITTIGFVDNETPGGAVDGSNVTYTLAFTPIPAGSLAVYRNGLHLSPNVDFTLNNNIITLVSAQTPQPGDILTCWYRIAQ